MPTLHWIGKDKVINHHIDVPFKVLEHTYGFDNGNQSEKETGSGNKIIHGDNLEALKALLPEYEGKVKCIYIDPPYNTGNETWVYNDNVNDPRLEKWINEVVGKEGDDLSRHDKWCCMMYPRLKLLHKLLSDDGGIIFISIDDNELANLKIIMDEIFGLSSFIEYFSWIKTSTAPSLAKKSRKTAEYVLCYEKKRTNRKYKAEEGDGGDAPLLNTGNASVELIFPKETLIFKLDDGIYPIGQYGRLTLNNEVFIQDGFADQDLKLTGAFKWTQETLNEEIQNGTTFIIKSEKFAIRYLRETETFKAPTNLLKEKYFTPLVDKKESEVDTNEGAKKEIIDIFGKPIFDYPKPSSLVEFFVKFMDDKNGIVLDSFAGTGTTAHAVLELNKQDKGNRKFILIEMEDYADNITAERVKRVINGYGQKESINGSFDYYELGQPMFLEDGNLNESVGEEKIRKYVYYTETKTLFSEVKYKDNRYYLGKHNDTAYYFNYEKDSITTLNHAFLSSIKNKAEQYVIYADNCLLTKAFMTKHHIIFKKIPRDITRF
ncbi:MAG: site-specific DNA-methyltransferase [Bacteroidales bacterium]|jgi:adenine-specific DNA-methyltransferase|nr:site-specific DNA-methyltransferase [Bacteroidales bacterium]